MTTRYINLTNLIKIRPPRPKECQTCDYSREKMAPKGVRILVCVFENPTVDPEGRAVWPKVEPDEDCRRHKYDKG